MIQVQNYKVSMNESLLFHVDDFQVQKGCVYYLLGKNGCGKSTFLKSILKKNKQFNALKIDSQDHSIYSPKELARKIAYVASKVGLDEYITVEDFLLLGRYPHGKPFSGVSQQDKAKISETLHLLEIASLQHKRLNELSDGQQQLVSIGRAIVQEVDYIFLDEPTAFLDYLNKLKIMHVVQKLSKDKQIGIVIVTHDIEFVFKHSESVYYVDTYTKELKKICLSDELKFDQVIQMIYGESQLSETF